MKTLRSGLALLQRLTAIEYSALLIASGASVFAVAWVGWIAPARADATVSLEVLESSRQALDQATAANQPSPAPAPPVNRPLQSGHRTQVAALRARLQDRIDRLDACETPAADAAEFLDRQKGIKVTRITLPAPQLISESMAIGQPVLRQAGALQLTSSFANLHTALVAIESRRPDLQWELAHLDSEQHPHAQVQLNFFAFCQRTPA